MLTELDLNAFNKLYKIKEKRIDYLSRGLISVGLIIAAMLGAVTFASLFHVSLLLTSLIFLAGIVVDAQIYLEKLPKLMQLIFLRHLFMGLETENIVNALVEEKKINHQAKHLYLDKWVYLRRKRFKTYPKGIDKDQKFLNDLQQISIEDLTSENYAFILFASTCQQRLIESRKLNQNWLKLKKALVILGLPLSLAVGLGYGSIAYTSFFTLLSLLGISTVAFPYVWFALAVGVSVIAGAFWTATMYKTVYSAIKGNIFSKIANKLTFNWAGYQASNRTGKLSMLAQASLRYVAVAFLATLGLIGVIANCGAFGSAILEVFSFVPSIYIFFIGIFILPVRALFALKHVTSAVACVSKKISQGYAWLCSKPFSTHLKTLSTWFTGEFCKQPIKLTCIGLLGALLFTATIFHVLAEAALDMGGDADNVFWQRLFTRFNWSYQAISRALQVVSYYAQLSTQQLIVFVQSSIEFLEHMDFAFKQTPEMVKSLVAVPSEMAAFMKGVIQALKSFIIKQPVNRDNFYENDIVTKTVSLLVKQTSQQREKDPKQVVPDALKPYLDTSPPKDVYKPSATFCSD